jgi:hypothetical protein
MHTACREYPALKPRGSGDTIKPFLHRSFPRPGIRLPVICVDGTGGAPDHSGR